MKKSIPIYLLVPVYILLPVVMAFLLSSCEHKELCYGHTYTAKVNVVFDWKKAPDASPESMDLYLFSEKGGTPLRYQFAGCKGGTISLPPGTYRAICLNSDTETSLYRGVGEFETFEVYTREASLLATMDGGFRSTREPPRAEGTETERVMLSPEMVWSDKANYDGAFTLTVNAGHAASETEQTFVLTPGQSVCTYTVTVLNAENLQYAKSLSGTLSGMSSGYLPGLGEPSGCEQCIVPFPLNSDGISTLTGEFHTFGECSLATHQLVIYAVLADGSGWIYTYDVTKQVRTAKYPLRVDIIVSGLPLPKPITNGNGFHPDVDDWNDVHITLPM